MRILRSPLLRLLMVGLPALGLQTTLLAEMRPFGVVLQLMLLLSAAAGVSAGPERGALAGFVMGLLFDLVLPTPLGLHALVFGLAGYMAGYAHTLTAAHPWWLTMLVVGGASLGAMATYPVVAAFVGLDGWLTPRLIKVALVVGASNMVVAPAAVGLQRWCFGTNREIAL